MAEEDGLLPVGRDPIEVGLRREGDSNPRSILRRTTVFETAAFDHSAISPKKIKPAYALAGKCGERGIRTPGTSFPVRQFSKLLVSATHPSLLTEI